MLSLLYAESLNGQNAYLHTGTPYTKNFTIPVYGAEFNAEKIVSYGSINYHIQGISCNDSLINDYRGLLIIHEDSCYVYDVIKDVDSLNFKSVVICRTDSLPIESIDIGPNGEGDGIETSVFMMNRSYCDSLILYCGQSGEGTFYPIINNCDTIQDDDIIVWGNLPGEGDFSIPLNESGWITRRPDSIYKDLRWDITYTQYPIYPALFGHNTIFGAPTACNGSVEFSSVKFAMQYYNPAQTPPYSIYGSELISPTIDCSSNDSIYLEFYYQYNALNLSLIHI